MQDQNLQSYLQQLLENCPQDWLKLTTHRLDIYHEDQAKTEFLDELEGLFQKNDFSANSLAALPTAYDYIRLGHPISSVLEWALAKQWSLDPAQVISFGSLSMPILAVLRTHSLQGRKTRILYQGELPEFLDFKTLEQVYHYQAEAIQYNPNEALAPFDGPSILLSANANLLNSSLAKGVDYFLSLYPGKGSVLVQTGSLQADLVAAIQHVRRRETIAMTPANCFALLQAWLSEDTEASKAVDYNLEALRATVKEITLAPSPALFASSGLSMQYAIMMGLIEACQTAHPGKEIQIIVPPNCYGGTNDQARRVAASLSGVSVMDLPVDGDSDMVQSTGKVLKACAEMDAIPLIIAEIPTNPRVEVPDLEALHAELSELRKTLTGQTAVDPVFILDQTFCPNIPFLKEAGHFSGVRTIAYVSGSKFPSGGKCTAGYCVANAEASSLMVLIDKHLQLCDNAATPLQMAILEEQMPSMLARIQQAYVNTRDFVSFISEQLPAAKINFVSEALAADGFTPSVFSLDLPTKGDTAEARENYKRELNLKLIQKMITEIPDESKYCVSYGQLKGCYWTIPATSTQGTTKEADKDYIARVSVSPNLDLEKHKAVFADFVKELSE